MKTYRSDNRGEFPNNALADVFSKYGIKSKLSVSYHPEHSGRAEREMRTLVEAARTMPAGKKLGKKFWAEAIGMAAHVINRTGNSSVPGKTTYHVRTKKDNLDFSSLLSPFGADVWVQVPKQKRGKRDVKSRKGIFVDYFCGTKIVRVYFPDTNSISVERDVIFIPEKTEPLTGKSDVPVPDTVPERRQF